jgi:8-oxo-dGTP pyrophosphatase MutT (NUDIX family)
MNFTKQLKHRNIVCNNCREVGHKYYQCLQPIVSCGIILFCKSEGKIHYLMVRRRSSFGYNDVLLGNYELDDICQIQDYIDEMTMFEKEKVLCNEYLLLWNEMWTRPACPDSHEKFNNLKETVYLLIENSKSSWEEPEWEFPKGRRNMHESDLNCAKREFEEETGIPISQINMIENIEPFHETFQGSDHKMYTNRFYLAKYSGELVSLNMDRFQLSEISKLEWKDITVCNSSIRKTNQSKLDLLNTIHEVIEKFTFY